MPLTLRTQPRGVAAPRSSTARFWYATAMSAALAAALGLAYTSTSQTPPAMTMAQVLAAAAAAVAAVMCAARFLAARARRRRTMATLAWIKDLHGYGPWTAAVHRHRQLDKPGGVEDLAQLSTDIIQHDDTRARLMQEAGHLAKRVRILSALHHFLEQDETTRRDEATSSA